MTEYYVTVRFGDEHFVREFITVNSFKVQKVASNFSFIQDPLDWNYTNIKYPIGLFGEPLTSAKFSYALNWLAWKFESFKPYIWQFPYETMTTKLGICIDTANLMTTFLRLMKLDAYTVLGEVVESSTNKLVGYHAWTEYSNWILETTIHKGQGDPSNIQILKDDAYSGKLRLKYVPILWFNDEMSREDTEGKAQELFLKFFGENSSYKNIREFLRSEKEKQHLIWSIKAFIPIEQDVKRDKE